MVVVRAKRRLTMTALAEEDGDGDGDGESNGEDGGETAGDSQCQDDGANCEVADPGEEQGSHTQQLDLHLFQIQLQLLNARTGNSFWIRTGNGIIPLAF